MNDKPWWKQKTFYEGVASILAGGILCATGSVAVGAPMIAQGLIGIFVRDAIKNIPAPQPRGSDGKFVAKNKR